MNRLNPRNPMVIDTRELQRRPGSMQEVSRVVGAPEDLGTEVISVPMGAPVELELRLESVVEGVLLSGSVSATATGACVRCLETATYPVAVTLQELFAYPDRAAHHLEVAAESDEDDVRELVDDLIDLEPVLRDAVVPALPFQPVCRVDCPGLCSECGALLAQDPDHHHDLLDPRWASLSGLLDDAGRGSAETEKRN
ncbi:MAG: YceD family protein [Lapillicoccus sp.]